MNDPQNVIIDLSEAQIFDSSSVAALDAIELKYHRYGKNVEIIGMNEPSAKRCATCSPLATASPIPKSAGRTQTAGTVAVGAVTLDMVMTMTVCRFIAAARKLEGRWLAWFSGENFVNLAYVVDPIPDARDRAEIFSAAQKNERWEGREAVLAL